MPKGQRKKYAWHETSEGRAVLEQLAVEKAALHKCRTPSCSNQTTNYYCYECRIKRAKQYGGVEDLSSYDPLNS